MEGKIIGSLEMTWACQDFLHVVKVMLWSLFMPSLNTIIIFAFSFRPTGFSEIMTPDGSSLWLSSAFHSITLYPPVFAGRQTLPAACISLFRAGTRAR